NLGGQEVEIALRERLDIGVDDRRRSALVLAYLRRHLGRKRNEEPRKLALDYFAGAPLVRRIGVGMQEDDRKRSHARLRELAHAPDQRLLVERLFDAAAGSDALGHFEPQPAAHQ